MEELKAKSTSGYFMLLVLAVVIGAAVLLISKGVVWGVGLIILSVILFKGFYMVQPNTAKILMLFGEYVGTDRKEGLRWANPFYSQDRISLRVRNFSSDPLKVNDKNGNPIEIACVVVWKVVNSAEAFFQVDDYYDFVNIQSESALRNLASLYAYDADDDKQMSLRGNATEIADRLKEEVQERLSVAGVEVIETRISHLAYAREIAGAMLQRQQAAAIIAARKLIVEGAVSMVELALEQLSARDVVTFDEDKKAAMVSNLLVVLCGETSTQPVLNTGV